ncbi:hypothetical protein J2858_001324 [Neorhizobium galegae]|uniref:hypothetical protein n=1 Tax=Neorhizobium galegae TaxID=399 RepID=UPI001AE5CD03|nr:hypothetical protein [Neorhizobium galegae]MBP2548431.1 hypothetical protein [Neorhizobium galegae]
MNNRLDPNDTTSDPLTDTPPAHLQDPTFTRSATRAVEPPLGGQPAAERPLSPTEARQGNTGRPVLMVLVAGLVLALIAWGASEWWGQSTEPPAEQTATPPAGDTTPANPATQPSSTP